MELLNDMALFVEVVKAKGFRHAAEAMGIPNSTVSRRISSLENAIGLRLLHRTTRRIELTEAGQIYFERCKRIVDEAKRHMNNLGVAGPASGWLPVVYQHISGTADAEFRPPLSGYQLRFDLTRVWSIWSERLMSSGWGHRRTQSALGNWSLPVTFACIPTSSIHTIFRLGR
jgi:DNA-binding transcriptional LysR family regulator